MARSLDDLLEPAIAATATDHDAPVLRGPDHLAANKRVAVESFRSGPTPAPPARGKVRRGRSSVRRPRGSHPRDRRSRITSVSPPCRRALRTARCARWRRAAPAPPTRPRGEPAPSAPVAAAPCEPSTPPSRSACSSARRSVPCRSGTARSSQPRATCSWAAARDGRELHGVPNARPRHRAPGAAWHVGHHCSSHVERSLIAASRSLRWAPSAHRRETMLHRCCKLRSRGVHRRLFVASSRGQVAGSAKYLHLRDFSPAQRGNRRSASNPGTLRYE